MEIGRILSKFQYADARIERSIDSVIRITNDEVKESAGSTSGIGVRVLENGSWGFASSNSANADVEALLKKAQRLAGLSKGKIKLALPKIEKKNKKDRVETVSSEEQVKTLIETAKAMEDRQVASRNLSCMDARVAKEFYNSEGSEITQETGYSYLSCSCIARDGMNIQRGAGRSSSRKGFGMLDLKVAQDAKDKAIRLLKASPSPKGRFTVVLDPEMTGVFSHEAVGHACEADSVLDRESILADKLGKRVGNELVSIADDPTASDFGGYHYDDEGVEAKKTVLVRNGVLQNFMTSMETAKALGLETNGHARADGFESVPIIRMSNTYFQKGDASLEDVFDIRSGVYLKGMRGGSVDIFSGGFMFKAEESHGIKNGEKTGIMRDVTISGNILETMLNVECVGRDFGTSPGMCGKFAQEAPVSDGGPHLRLRNVAIG